MARTKKNNRAASGESSSAKPLALALTGFLVAAIAVVALMATVGGAGGGSFTPNDQGLLQPGTQAPQADVQTANGGSVSIPDAGGEGPTLLVFFATWCPHCNDEAPVISELSKDYENLNVVMAGIDGQDNPEKVRQFVEEYDIEGEVLYEPSLGQTYQVSGYPTTYVINDSGEIVAANSGETPENVLRNWIERAQS